jgi:hypothetical protein
VRAAFVRSDVLSMDEYRDIGKRAATERKIAEQMSALCDTHTISWAATMLLDEDGRYVKAWRCVGTGEGDIA